MAQISVPKVVPPQIDWIDMKNWALSDLETTFVVPEFQRRTDTSHVNEMLSAILHNKFYDTVFHGCRRKDGKVELLDGQHTLLAFIKAYKEHGLKRYDFMLALYSPEKAREIFRQLNIGKKLTISDHLRAYDIGQPILNALRTSCFHYRNQDRLGYIDVLSAISYTETGDPHTRLYKLEEMIDSVTKKEIEFCSTIMPAFKALAPRIPMNPLYRSAIFRNIWRLAFENDLSTNGVMEMIKKVVKDPKLMEMSKNRGTDVIKEVYLNMKGLLKL